MRAILRISWTLSLLAACSGSGTVTLLDAVPDNSAAPTDSVVETGSPADVVEAAAEVRDEELREDADFNRGGCKPGEGCFGDKCLDNLDCQSGFCVEHMGDGVCTQVCSEECPAGWSCKAISGAGRDLVYVCVSDHANLCRPCQDNGGCGSAGGVDDVCVDYGTEGSFCGGTCKATQQCPWGFSCKMAKSVDGIESMQCIADTGLCPCTGKSVELKLWTPCQSVSEWGSCSGKRVCEESGLTECDAPVPAREICNGIDDDCDGDVDEPDLLEGVFVPLCDDGNPCTKDSCAADAGCVNTVLDEGECGDGNPCTVADHCVDGQCVGDLVECDDENPCTENVCTKNGGCEYLAAPGSCDDGNPCTVGDQCNEGTCAGFAVECDCKAGGDCAVLEDGDLCNGTLFCSKDKLPYQCAVLPGSEVQCPIPSFVADGKDWLCLQAACDPATAKCSLVPGQEGLPCDDGDPCTLDDACASGLCAGTAPANCNDGNPCTDDSCLPQSGCLHIQNSAPCNDADACTTGDLCVEGMCQGGGILSCNDGNPCTDDSCDPQKGCVVQLNQAACDDGNACTGPDQCKGGSCVATGLLGCKDDNPCTDDACDPAVGCTHVLNQAPCDDGNVCTSGDQCTLGACKGGGTLKCDDGNPCTLDSCDPLAGCLHKPNSLPCDDLNFCTQGDLCSNGVCLGVKAVDCNDSNLCTDDWCEPAKGCQHSPNTAPCDDGSVCTLGDKCGQGKCQTGTSLGCNDGNPCTLDSCSPDSGCVYSPQTAPCDDGNACTTGDSCLAGTCSGGPAPSCDDSNVCTDDFCSPATGCVHVNNAAGCSDGDTCTLSDSCSNGTCKPGALMLDCQDGNACTQDACLPLTGCTHTPLVDGTDCGAGKKCKSGQCVADVMASCLAWKTASPNSPDGVYQVDPDGNGGDAPFQVYCDMTQDGGGWTLVYRDNIEGALLAQTTGAQGDPAGLLSLSGASAKFSDAVINKLKAYNDTRIGYRCSSPTVAHRYFFPSECTYQHSAHDLAQCRRYTYTFSTSNSPSYQQCTNWGGNSGGLDAWYGCNGTSEYTNVVKTHSAPERGMSGITDNYLGNKLGAAGGTVQYGAPPGGGYNNKLLMWVK